MHRKIARKLVSGSIVLTLCFFTVILNMKHGFLLMSYRVNKWDELVDPQWDRLKDTSKTLKYPVNTLDKMYCKSCFSTTNGKYAYFAGKYSLNVTPMKEWVSKENVWRFCDDNVIIYNDLFTILHGVRLDPMRREQIYNQAKGGEEIKEVLHQSTRREEYIFKNDFLQMHCLNNTNISERVTKMKSLKSLKLVPVNELVSIEVSDKVVEDFVIAVRRKDYTNLHNWVRDIFNTFLMMIHFRIQPANVTVLFMDGHPRSELDKAWAVLYGQPKLVGRMSTVTVYRNFILGLEENKGPITEYRNTHVPYLEEFREFVLSQFGLDSVSPLDCSRPRITVIIRRDAVYHPRNVEGRVGRKIFNEAELMDSLMNAFPHACVKLALMEALPMVSQLDVIRKTDILIGMHGAGMSHITFLPSHAGVLELFSKGFKVNRPWFECFYAITRWRNMVYDSWENFDSSIEMPADFTILPTQIIVNKTKGIMDKICTSKVPKSLYEPRSCLL